MIYPTAIFRTVIALSTVAATTQATVAGPRPSIQGSKRGKGTARYIDTAADLYETTVLNVASPNTYTSAAANTKAGVNLRTITSPDATSGKFSYASPTDVAGAVTLIKQSDTMNTYIVQSPRTDKGVKNTKTYGTNVAGHTSAKKRGQQGGFGVGVGTILDVLNGYGATGQQGGYSKQNGAVHDSYGKNGASGGERSSYGKSEHGGKKGSGGKKAGKKNGNEAYSPSTGGNSIRVTPSTGGNPYVPAPPAPSTLNPTPVYGGNHKYGNGSKGTNAGGSPEAPASSTGSGYGASGSGNPGQSSKSGSGSNKGGHGSNGSVKNSNSGSVAGSHAATEAPVPSGPTDNGTGSKGINGNIGGSKSGGLQTTPPSPVPSSPAGYGSGSNDGKLNSSGNDNVGQGSTPTPAPTSAPMSLAPSPTVTPCNKSKSKQNGAKQSSNSYKQSGRN
ncbi:hypothetical protein PI124_g6349 [Phytophthora idaei]|nr:hypothetical protein PI124_g6349 [Phytophthora idaei]